MRRVRQRALLALQRSEKVAELKRGEKKGNSEVKRRQDEGKKRTKPN